MDNKDNPLLDRIRSYKCKDKLCSYIKRWILINLQDKLDLLTFLNEVMNNWVESMIHIVVSDQFPDKYNDLDDTKKEALLSVDNQIIKDFFKVYESEIKAYHKLLDDFIQESSDDDMLRIFKEYDWFEKDLTCFAINKIIRGICMSLYA